MQLQVCFTVEIEVDTLLHFTIKVNLQREILICLQRLFLQQVLETGSTAAFFSMSFGLNSSILVEMVEETFYQYSSNKLCDQYQGRSEELEKPNARCLLHTKIDGFPIFRYALTLSWIFQLSVLSDTKFRNVKSKVQFEVVKTVILIAEVNVTQ